jgi:thiol:disulfide interchange protein DsbC
MISERRRTLPAVIAFTAVIVTAATVFASSAVLKPEVAFKQAFPQIAFQKIEPTEIRGVYEVTAGSNILYYYPEKDLIIVGEIYGKDMQSITAAKKAEMKAREIKNLPLDKAVKIGDGKNVVIEFTDPDCPYCRRASTYLKTKTDMTRYVFFAPLAHPAAITKIQYILNAADKGKAYEEMMDGKTPELPAKGFSSEIKALAQEHMDWAKKVGVDGTPTFFINGKTVVGADTARIDELLKKGPEAK